MHYFRALLATTLVTAVLTTPINVLVRRTGPEDIITASTSASDFFLTLNAELLNATAAVPTPSQVVDILKTNFPFAVGGIGLITNAVNGIPSPLNSSISEQILGNNIVPLMEVINDTFTFSAQAALNIKQAHTDDDIKTDFQAALETLFLKFFPDLVKAIASKFTGNTDVQAVFDSLDENFRQVDEAISSGLGL